MINDNSYVKKGGGGKAKRSKDVPEHAMKDSHIKQIYKTTFTYSKLITGTLCIGETSGRCFSCSL